MIIVKRILGAVALGTVLLLGLSPVPAQAYIVTLKEVGNDVVATGSGSIYLTSLANVIPSDDQSHIVARGGIIVTGPTASTPTTIYSGFTGSKTFGNGPPISIAASSGSGDLVGIDGFSVALEVPRNYNSGDPLSSTATWLNQTFATLGVTRGTYAWTWGTGEPNENFLLAIGTTAAFIPEPASFTLLGTALAGLLLVGTMRRTRSCT